MYSEDTVRTAEIHVYGWRIAYAGIIPDEELYNNRNVEKAITSHKYIIDNNPDIFDIYDDGIVKGIILHSDSRDESSEDCYELFAIYVEPSFISFAYRCAKCNQEFEISAWVDFIGPHGPDKSEGWKYLKCPDCHKKSMAAVTRKEKVIELTERLKSAGYEVIRDPRTTGDGYFESTVFDPERNIIEITE